MDQPLQLELDYRCVAPDFGNLKELTFKNCKLLKLFTGNDILRPTVFVN